MKNRSVVIAALTAAACLAPSLAVAHVTLEVKEARVNSTYKAVFRVPHGCSGKAMTRLRVQIPDGVIAAKPMPKAGWTLETVKAAYAMPVKTAETTITEGVREVSWRGSLLDENYDEFVINMSLGGQLKAGTTLYFPVVQECGDAADRWIEIPKDGEKEPPHPAPGVKLLPRL